MNNILCDIQPVKEIVKLILFDTKNL